MPRHYHFLAATLLLAGCNTTVETAARRKDVSQMTHAEFCAEGVRLLGSRYIDPFQKAALYEMIRNKGCMGGAQAQPASVFPADRERTLAEARERITPASKRWSGCLLEQTGRLASNPEPAVDTVRAAFALCTAEESALRAAVRTYLSEEGTEALMTKQRQEQFAELTSALRQVRDQITQEEKTKPAGSKAF